MRFLLSLLPLALLLGSALPFLSAQCTISGQKAYPTPTPGSTSAGCATAATLGQASVSSVPSLQGSPNPFPLFQVNTPWSFALWVNPSSSATDFLFLVVEQQVANYFCSNEILSLQISSPANGGVPRIGQCNNAGVNFNGKVNFDQWNHLVYQYDGQGTFEVYINSVSAPAGSPSTFTPAARSSTVNFVYLNAARGTTATFGQLSTVRLYSAPLTACQVESDMAGLRQPGLVAEYASQYNQVAPGEVQLTDAITQSTYFICNNGGSGTTNCNI